MNASGLSAITLGLAFTALSAQVMAEPGAPGAPANASPAPTNTEATVSSSGSGWTQGPEPATAPAATPIPAPAPTPTTEPAATQSPATAQPSPAPVATATSPAVAQAPSAESDEPPTLFGGRATKVGGYGALGVRYGRLLGENGVLTGVEGALLLDHRFAIGLAGYNWATQRQVANAGYLTEPYLHYGYGGLLVRYHVYIPNSPVYVSAAALVGAGVIGLTTTWDGDLYRENADVFFAFEPQLGVHVNLTRWMRFGLDAGYRVHAGIQKFGYTESDFNGVSLGGNLGFGWF